MIAGSMFEGEGDINGAPFRDLPYCPRKLGRPTTPLYVMHTIDILSSLADKPREVVFQELVNMDRDIMYIRVDDDADVTSVPIDVAASQINELKQLVLYGVSSEKSKRQYYDQILPSARGAIERFDFGHTVAGSFGFRLEAKLDDRQPSEQLALRGLQPKPIGRSVMERILRGLVATDESVTLQDARPLLEGYENGFNSNMCASVVKIAKDYRMPVQYRMKWSHMYEGGIFRRYPRRSKTLSLK